MVKEQRRIQELRLAATYNRSLGEAQTAKHYGSMPETSSGNGFSQKNDWAKPQPTQSREFQSNNSSRPDDLNHHQPERDDHRPSTSTTTLGPETVQQIRSLVAQGYRIGIENVDQRRFRIGSWQSCGLIQTQNESEAIATLESCLTNHKGEYVRLFGIDASKRRVLETIIQRPNR